MKFLSRLDEEWFKKTIDDYLSLQNDDELCFSSILEKKDDYYILAISDSYFKLKIKVGDYDAEMDKCISPDVNGFRKYWIRCLYKEFKEEYKESFFDHYHEINKKEYDSREEKLCRDLYDMTNSNEMNF